MANPDKNNKENPPRQRRKAARPGEIIDAALIEFAEHGFAGARLDDVARRAGIVKGTIYRYFPSKDALFQAALTSRYTPMFDELDTLIDGYTGTMAALLHSTVEQLYKQIFGTDIQILMRIIIAEGNRFPDIAKLFYEQTISKGSVLLGKIVNQGIERGEFRQGTVDDLPLVILGPVVMVAVWKMTFDQFDPIDIEHIAATHADLILNGLNQR